MSASRYYFDSLVPAWLAADPGYRAALGQHLLDRMALQEWEPVSAPTIEPAPGEVPPPVGTVLLRVFVDVEEFDLDLGDEDTQEEEQPPAAGQWLVYQAAPDRVHVVPLDDEIVHEHTEHCVCVPTARPEPTSDGSACWVFVHHSLDGREQHEPGAAGG